MICWRSLKGPVLDVNILLAPSVMQMTLLYSLRRQQLCVLCFVLAPHLHNLTTLFFNAQLIAFSRPSSAVCFTSGSFTFCGQQLNLRKTVSHLGHTLSCDLSDNPDITSVKKDLCRKANYMLHTFSSCDPFTRTELFRSYCLSLYGSSLWSASFKELKSLEVCSIILYVKSGICHPDTTFLFYI